MKQLLIMFLILTATLTGAVSRVQAAPLPDPWEIIIHESMRESSDKAERAPTEQHPVHEPPGPAMGTRGERHMAGEMPKWPEMPCGERSFMGGAPPAPMGAHHSACITCMLKILGLTDAQKKQIADIAKDDRAKAAPNMEKREGIMRQLRQAERAETFDEKAVRSLAGKLAQTEIDMTVARAKLHSRINAVLTPVQRAIMEKMATEMPCPPGPRPGDMK